MSPPPGAIFQARLLDNQEGANAERHAFGKFSGGVSNAELFGTETIPTTVVETSTTENRPRCPVVPCSKRIVQLTVLKFGFSIYHLV